MQNELQKIIMAQKEIEKVVKGKSQKISKIIAAILAKGHILLEDVPGVGKTTTALAFSKVMNLSYGRVQFTPDVLPTDITGFSMFNKQTGVFEYKRGAVMCNLFLADEINRTSPKTQSALLQVMEERRITIDGKNFVIPEPFICIATQNPLGSAGTQKLPDSQLDRFMIKLSMGYPDKKNEIDILKGGNDSKKLDKIRQILTADDVLAARTCVENMYVADNIYEYIAELINATRESEYIKVGLSTRAGLALINLAKSYAFLTTKTYVTPEDVVRAYYDVSEHRIVLNNKAKMENLNCRKVLEYIKGKVEVPIVQNTDVRVEKSVQAAPSTAPVQLAMPQPVKPVAEQPVKPVATPPVEAVKPVAEQPVKPVATPPVAAVQPVVEQPVKPVATPPVEAVQPVVEQPVKPVAIPPVAVVKPVVEQPVKPVATPPVAAVQPVAEQSVKPAVTSQATSIQQQNVHTSENNQVGVSQFTQSLQDI